MPATTLRLLVLLVLSGCTAAKPTGHRYDPDSGRSTYTSPAVLMGFGDMSIGLASGQRVMWRAVASCAGQACTPPSVELVLLNNGDTELNLDSRRVQLVFDGTTRDFEDLGRTNEPAYFSVPRGEFFRLSLSGTDFARMAAADDVEVRFGKTGSVSFKVPFDRRDAFRALVAQMRL